MPLPRKVRIGTLLLEAGAVTKKQLDSALEIQKKKGGKLGDILIQQGVVKEIEFNSILATQMRIPLIELEHYSVKPKIIMQLPEKLCRRDNIILFDKIDGEYVLGITDPTDIAAYDEVTRMLHVEPRVSIVRQAAIHKVLDEVYRRTGDIESFAEELQAELLDSSGEPDENEIETENITNSAPVTKMISSIFQDAVQIGASDVHIEPNKDVLRIRQRIDGILHEEVINEKKIMSALIVKLKIMAGMDITEKRIPQDGRFRIVINNKEIDVRASTMPIRHGEAIVMRLLDQSKGVMPLDDLFYDKSALARIKYHLTKPNGLILVTGPTGSGKSTTLYSALAELNDKTKKIITIEDPVEYTLERINQVQINNSVGLTFATVLRAILRQDPEIIMIGEMRDEETAVIGLRAALTGHLVLSTLHTNDSISSAIRLMDMGIKGYLIAGALKLVIAQRLMKKNCTSCIVQDTPSAQELELLVNMGHSNIDKSILKKGKGCGNCHNTGYKGRIIIFEILEMNNELSCILTDNDSNKFSAKAKEQENFKPLITIALEHALNGNTSLEEVFRIAEDI